jgi:hypothetical protein
MEHLLAKMDASQAEMKINQAKTDASLREMKEEMLAKLDAHHERMMARMDSARENGGHRFGGKSRRNRV